MEWKFRPRYYPHFDHVISKESEALGVIRRFQQTGKHAFLPFLEYQEQSRRFSKYLEKLKSEEAGNNSDDIEIVKIRPIKYASHADSQVFSYYRTELANKYEVFLEQNELSEHPIAYRKLISSSGSSIGKCNIHYAKEAFDEVCRRDECVAITLDIKSFFESLDHQFLKKKLCEVLGCSVLPQDYLAIFKEITDYKVVNKDACYERLGLVSINDNKRKFLHCPNHIFRERKMLCNKQEYREKIIGGGLIKKNDYGGKATPQGIPQGSPISDVLANIYLIDFDKEMSILARNHGAYYRRYSDDILWICASDDANVIKSSCVNYISKQGKQTLAISESKTTETHFFRNANRLSYTGNLFSYLGFSFNGQEALYRDKTISNYQRNVVFSIRNFIKVAENKTNGNPKKKIKKNWRSLKENLNIPQMFHKLGYPNKKHLYKQGANSNRRMEGNFMTYHLRAVGVFNIDASSQYKLSNKQLRHYKDFIRKTILRLARKVDPAFSI